MSAELSRSIVIPSLTLPVPWCNEVGISISHREGEKTISNISSIPRSVSSVSLRDFLQNSEIEAHENKPYFQKNSPYVGLLNFQVRCLGISST